MKPGPLLYAAVCALALVYLLYTNLHGYVPFAANAASAVRGATAGRFHK
jgi:hypothetical protein